MKKYLLLFLMLTIYNLGYSQFFDSTDYQIIFLKDTIISGTPHLHFKMTTNGNNSNSGYSDFVFIDQNGDTITAPTYWSMWLPEANNPSLDTSSYILNFKIGITSFPTNFNGYLKVRNPGCTIPFNYSALSAPSINEGLESIRIYPNPSVDQLYISSNSSTQIDFIQIYDLNGALLSLDMSLNNYLDISDLPQGTYFIRIHSNGISKTFKIQKN